METPHSCTVLVYATPIWPPEINKNIWSSHFLWQLFRFTRELAYVRINMSSNTWNGYSAENQEKRLFQGDSIPILVSRTVETRKFKLLYFRNENLYKDLLFLYFQRSVNKNSQNVAIFKLSWNISLSIMGLKSAFNS